MNCRDTGEHLDDFVDGLLPAGLASELSGHLESCESCRLKERELRRLLERASSLSRDETPGRDLWPEISSRLSRASRDAGYQAKGGGWRPWLAAAAGVLVVMSTAVVSYRVGREASLERFGVGGPIDQGMAIPAGYVPIATVEEEYAKARRSLLEILDQRRDRLSPETLASIGENLRLIDQSVTDIRAALREDPSNRELTQLLLASYRKQVDLLQHVHRMSI
jgi:hypothetical protein